MDTSIYHYDQLLIRRERQKILFQYVLTLLISLLSGGIFVGLLSDEFFSAIVYQTSVHFELVFSNIASFSQGILLVLRYAVPDLLCIAICFIFAFSSIHCLVSDLILLFEGFTAGFSGWLMFQMEWSRTPPFANSGYLITFLLFRGSMMLGFLLYCRRTALIAMTLRQHTEVGRSVFPPRMVLILFGSALSFIGATLMITGIYTLILYLM
ncbi:MAG: hypothetical protein IJY47_01635 [Clostridia bacterium]|nr:hypothetical protein [Clostridia bacterium]